MSEQRTSARAARSAKDARPYIALAVFACADGR